MWLCDTVAIYRRFNTILEPLWAWVARSGQRKWIDPSWECVSIRTQFKLQEVFHANLSTVKFCNTLESNTLWNMCTTRMYLLRRSPSPRQWKHPRPCSPWQQRCWAAARRSCTRWAVCTPAHRLRSREEEHKKSGGNYEATAQVSGTEIKVTTQM